MTIRGNPLPQTKDRSPAVRIGGAVGCVLIAFLVRLLLDPLLGDESPFMLLLAGIMLGAWFGGLRAGLLATLLATLLSDYFFVAPGGWFLANSSGQNAQLLFFLLEGVLISGLTAHLYDARLRVAARAQRRVEAEAMERQDAQQALRESESKFQLALQQSPISVYTMDRELRYTWIYNPRFGFKPDQMLGKRDDELLPAEQVAELMEMKQRVLATGEGARQRITTTINNELLAYNVTVEPLRDEDGVIQGITVITMDVSEYERVERALLESEARFRNAIDNFPDVFVIYDRERRFQYVNAHAVETTGWPETRFIGQRDEDLFPSELTDQYVPTIEQAIETKTAQPLELMQPEWLGGRTQIVHYVPLLDADGTVQTVLGVTIDITERKRAEEALIESENRFRSSVENLPDAFVIYAAIRNEHDDIVDFRVTYANEAACLLTGRKRRDYIGKTVLTLYPGLDQTEIFDWYIQVVETGQAVIMEDYAFDTASQGRAGIRYFDFRIGSLNDGFTVVWRDVTERKKRNEALRESEATLNTILDTLPTGVVIANTDGEIVRFNAAARDLWGVPPETTSWKDYSNFVAWWPDTGERIKADEWAMSRAVKQGEVTRGELIRNQCFDSTEQRYYLNNVAPLYDDNGQIVGGVAAMQDVTKQIKAQEALQKQREVFEQIIDSLPVMITIYEPSTEVLYLNPKCEELLGWRTDEIQDLDLMELIYPDPAYREMVRQFMQSLELGWRDFLLTARDGSIVESTWANIGLSDGRHVGIGIDIRQRKQAERRAHLLQTLAAALSTAMTQQEVGEITMREGVLALGASAGLLALVSEDEAHLNITGCVGYSECETDSWQQIPLDHPSGPVATAIQKGAPLWLTSLADCDAVSLIPELVPNEPHQACAILPSNIDSHVSSVLGLSFHAPREFDAAERAFLLTLSDYCAQALERARLTEQARELAATDERQRLARDLHDAVSQVLFASTTMAESIPLLWKRNPDRAQTLLNEVYTLNRAAMAEMRKLLYELRPEAIEQTPFEQLLDHLTRAMQAQKKIAIDLQVDIEHNGRLPPDPHVALYRIAQEALNNVVKHSGAGCVRVSCVCRDRRFRLSIEDDGQGFDPAQATTGLGMTTMHERALAIGAKLEIVSTVGHGTEVRVTWSTESNQST